MSPGATRLASSIEYNRNYMRRIVWTLVFAVSLCAQRKPITLENMSGIGTAGSGRTLGVWSPTGNLMVYREGTRLRIYDAAKQRDRDLVDTKPMRDAAVKGTSPDPDSPEPFSWENRRVTESPIQWSPSSREILYSTGGDVFLIHVAQSAGQDLGAKWEQLTKTPEPERDPKLSPDGKLVAYRRGWDLFAREIATGKETRLTTGGTDTLRNGTPDWVYPEELSLGTAYWWSPDSSAIAYLQFDTSHERLYPHADLLGLRALAEPQRYPQAGTPNPDVRLGIVRTSSAARGGATKWLQIGDTRDAYLIARAGWMPDSRSVFSVRLNRIQNRLDLLGIDVESGDVRTILRESDRYWINPPESPRFLKDGRTFLWLSERDGFRHIYAVSNDGSSTRQVTRGDWEVTSVAGVDETAGRVYYVSSEASPLERQIYSIALDGTGERRLSSQPGTHGISLSPTAAYYVDYHSSLSTPMSAELFDGAGKRLASFHGVDRSALDEYNFLPIERVSFNGPDPTVFYAQVIRPAGFRRNVKYPAIVRVYGGPGSQQVQDSWNGADFDQVLAHAGFVVWRMDNRGSTGRGHAFETPIYHNLGAVELADQKLGVEHLVSLGYVDPKRVGIMGWSYGGFMTLNALLNAPETFAAGAAGAPVTNWLNYDTIYTERFMGLPAEAEAVYKDTALPPKASLLKGKLLLGHNLEDDNVLFQNTAQMIEALDAAGKRYELQLYTQKTHGVTGSASAHWNASVLDFFQRALK